MVIKARVLFPVSYLACLRLNSEFSKLCLLITFLSKLFGLEVRLNMDTLVVIANQFHADMAVKSADKLYFVFVVGETLT